MSINLKKLLSETALTAVIAGTIFITTLTTSLVHAAGSKSVGELDEDSRKESIEDVTEVSAGGLQTGPESLFSATVEFINTWLWTPGYDYVGKPLYNNVAVPAYGAGKAVVDGANNYVGKPLYNNVAVPVYGAGKAVVDGANNYVGKPLYNNVAVPVYGASKAVVDGANNYVGKPLYNNVAVPVYGAGKAVVDGANNYVGKPLYNNVGKPLYDNVAVPVYNLYYGAAKNEPVTIIESGGKKEVSSAQEFFDKKVLVSMRKAKNVNSKAFKASLNQNVIFVRSTMISNYALEN